VILKLEQYNEEYVITLPNFYTRSIVTNPWVELGDDCFIVCLDTGYSASIHFELKVINFLFLFESYKKIELIKLIYTKSRFMEKLQIKFSQK